jgi:spore coat polysaccharide biosynthesis protein SpsF
LASHLEAAADYSGFDGMPLGTGVEVLNTGALEQAWEETSEQWDHEHVSPYLYKHPEKFLINRIKAPAGYCLEGSRVTIDTEDDYNYVCRLYRDLYKGGPLSIKQIIPWLRNNPGT